MNLPTCTKCKSQPSVFFRGYSGERLCKDCFIKSIIERVQRSINIYEMLEHSSKIAIGVSGGKDSLTLLHVLKIIEDNTHGSEIVAITIDEGIKGYREEALKIVKKNTRLLDLEWVHISFKKLFGISMDEIAAKTTRSLGSCSYCGVLRRRALNTAAKSIGADRLATGHTLDDMAQSAILNLIRGDLSKMHSLLPGGINQDGFVRRIKPLCEVPERETALFAYLSGFEFQSMSCPYAEEAIRNDARAWLNDMEEKRPGIMFTTFRTALKMMPQLKSTNLKACEFCGEPTAGSSCRVCQMVMDGNIRV